MCEILAPAGDKNSALAAINSGADAIYLGIKSFSARSSADNFDFDELKSIIDYAALFGVKVYVAMNTLVKQSELEDFISSAKKVWLAGADALIVQDIFLCAAIKEAMPEIVLHLSTQAGVCNEYGARLAKEAGFSRVILARETPIEDIEKIAQTIETEVFVQGALCTCFSGQCYFSSFAGGNSGNRGKCKQPCRKLYSIDRNGFEERAYRLSPSDLCVGKDILRLKEAGVYSFKIEGRMRRPEYVAAAVNYYRDILGGNDAAVGSDFSALKRTYNRGNYTKGLAFGQQKGFLSSDVQGHIGEYVGTVKVQNGRFFCESTQRFTKGDGFKILRSGREVCGGTFESEGRGGFYLSSQKRLLNGDKVFVTTDTALNARLVSEKRLLSADVFARFAVSEFPRVSINGFEYTGEERLTPAENRPLTEEDVITSFRKTGELPLSVRFGEVTVEGKPYMNMAALNAFRRAAYAAFADSIVNKHRAPLSGEVAIPTFLNEKNEKTAVIATNLNGVIADIGILKTDSFNVDISALTAGFSGEKFLYLPPFLSGKDINLIKPLCAIFDGIYCEGTYGIMLAHELGKPLFAGVGFNISNTVAAKKLCSVAKYFCISKELTLNEASPLVCENAFALTCGNIKLMDLIYCPFGRTCSQCDRRSRYTLTDDAGRKFPLRRYETSLCRFEIYNCADLLSTSANAGALYDCTLSDAAKISRAAGNTQELKRLLKDITHGHSSSPVF